jgi:hypothetical protein
MKSTEFADGSEAAPFVCETTMVTRATAALNDEILDELKEQDRSIASVLSIGGGGGGGTGLGRDDEQEDKESDNRGEN